MPAKHPIRFGLQTAPERASWPELVKVWKFAEDLGLDSMWTSDHLVTSLFQDELETDVFDGWTALAGLATQTHRVRMGVMITGNPYRHPGQLARIATTIDHMSEGRLIMGIGAGWFKLEQEMYGIEFRSPAERVHRMGEAIEVFKALWTQGRANYQGKYYQLKDAISEPKPVQKPHIPIWVGGWGEQLTLKYCARHADGWNLTGGPLSLPAKVEALRRHCEAEGRDFDDIEKSVMHMRLIVDDDPDRTRRIIEATAKRRGTTYEDTRGQYMIGSTEEMRDNLGKLIDLGFTHFVPQIVQPYDYEGIERWRKEVAQPFTGD